MGYGIDNEREEAEYDGCCIVHIRVLVHVERLLRWA